jgi:DNA polymerase/3'-5' exonuclease PolX
MILLKYARELAEDLKAQLSPYCERCEIAGSVRRRKPVCKDIEIVLVPRPRDIGSLKAVVDKMGKRIKGQITGKYTQRKIPIYDGVNVDIFIVSLDTWGLQMAIRTGPAKYSHHVLAMGWQKKGYHSEGGVLYPIMKQEGQEDRLDYNQPVFIREERELYKFLGLLWEEPWERTV